MRRNVHTVPTQQYRRWGHAPPVGHLDDLVGLHERAASAAERTVCRHVDTLFFAEIDDFLLRQGRAVLDLIDRRNDRHVRKELLQVLFAVVRHANGLDLARG